MKKIVVLVLVVFVAWLLSPAQPPPTPVPASIPATTLAPTGSLNTATPVLNRSSFSCDGRQYCSDMTSRAEAVYFIRNCPNTKMDGDNDGVPCESDSRF
jgi:hypothetical protein